MDSAAAGLPGSAGQFGWARAANTYFWVDPKLELVGIFMTQHMLSIEAAQYDFRVLAYQALAE